MSSFGQYFRVHTFGESHCLGVGCIVDGVPPRIPLTEDDIQVQLTRRRPERSHRSTGMCGGANARTRTRDGLRFDVVSLPRLLRTLPGQSALSTKRDEKDRVFIQSGTERGITLGSPISLFVKNEDQRPGDYQSMSAIPRPSHADFTYLEKYGLRSSSGGGRSSARETIGRVAAGAIAEKWLSMKCVSSALCPL